MPESQAATTPAKKSPARPASPAKKKSALRALPKVGQPKTPAKPKQVNTKSLEPAKMQKRLDSIYKLEQQVETAKASFELASQARRAAQAKLEEANDALEHEIREQRYGPGPLFNADGTGPAEKPQPEKPKGDVFDNFGTHEDDD